MLRVLLAFCYAVKVEQVGKQAFKCCINGVGRGSELQGLLGEEAQSCSLLFWTDSAFSSELEGDIFQARDMAK